MKLRRDRELRPFPGSTTPAAAKSKAAVSASGYRFSAGDTPASTAVELMHRKRLMMRKGNRRSDQLSATNPVARELLLVTLENCRIDLPTWFAEFIRWHEPNGL